MKSLIPLVLVFLGCSAYADDPGTGENAAEVPRKVTKAVSLHVDAPKYPQRALRRGIEGWVIVGFTVTKDGSTDEIEVLSNSIEDYFDDAAIEATRTRTYQPATLSGKPVMQGNMSVRVVFELKDSSGGVSKPFLKVYKKASRALDDKDYELAKSLIDKLEQNEKRLLAEVCYLDMLKARYFEERGNSKATLRYLERALAIADMVASKPIYISLLKRAIVANAKANSFHASLKHYDKLLEVDKELSPDDPIHQLATRERQTLNSDSTIQTTGKTAQSCRACVDRGVYIWSHILNRSRFLIDQVLGEVSEIELLCDHSTTSIAYTPETAWSVNRDGGECKIRVFGEKGTTFRLVELAPES